MIQTWAEKRLSRSDGSIQLTVEEKPLLIYVKPCLRENNFSGWMNDKRSRSFNTYFTECKAISGRVGV